MNLHQRRRRGVRVTLLLGVAALAGQALVGCGSDSGSAAASGRTTDADALTVVASTDVWGDIASVVGGDHVSVRSIISNPDQDPHSFEADSATLLAVSKADVVIENGGGYDDFMDRVVASSDSEATVINAVDVSGKKPVGDAELNEHVWYDFPSVQLVADRIAQDLGASDAAHAAEFVANARAFDAKVQQLIDREQAAAPKVSGRGIAITEPVPLYLTGALGLVDRTPVEFSEAVEEGDDVAVPVLKEALDLFSSGSVDALVYNEQTSGPVTEQVKAAAENAGVAVVPVTETLPDGKDYLQWMTANLDALLKALGVA